MAAPAALLLLGGLLGGLPQSWGGSGGNLGGSETPPELEEEVSIVRRSDPRAPHCFSRTLHDLSCFWESPGEPDPRRFRLQFRLEQDPWQDCPLRVTALSPRRGSRFWCSLPAAATVTFVPLELRVLPGTPPETTGTPPKTSETTGTPPETTGTPPETTGTPPKTSETTRTPPKTTGTPPETTGTPPKTSETTGTPPKTTRTPPKTTGTPPKTSNITGTPLETTRTPPKTTGTPLETTGTPQKTSNITGTPPRTTQSPPRTSGSPPGTAEPPPPVPPLFQRTIYIDQVVLPGPPQNVSVSAGGARGELCVRWAPPPGPYLHSSLIFELALSPPGGPPKTVGVPAGRREQGVGGLRGSTPYSVRARARPDGISYSGFWSAWSNPATASTAPGR